AAVPETDPQVLHGRRAVLSRRGLRNAIGFESVVDELHTAAGPQRIQLGVCAPRSKITLRPTRGDVDGVQVIRKRECHVGQPETYVPSSVRLEHKSDVRPDLDQLLAHFRSSFADAVEALLIVTSAVIVQEYIEAVNENKMRD